MSATDPLALAAEAKPVFGLNEAIATFRWSVDSNHKLWGYFNAVCAAVVTFAWTGGDPRPGLSLLFVTVLFVGFSIANGQLIRDFQATAIKSKKAIEKAWSANGAVAVEFAGLVSAFKPEPLSKVLIGHTAMWLLVLGVAWSRALVESAK